MNDTMTITKREPKDGESFRIAWSPALHNEVITPYCYEHFDDFKLWINGNGYKDNEYLSLPDIDKARIMYEFCMERFTFEPFTTDDGQEGVALHFGDGETEGAIITNSRD